MVTPGTVPIPVRPQKTSPAIAGAWLTEIQLFPSMDIQHATKGSLLLATEADGKVIGEWPTPAEVRTERSFAALALSLTTEDVSQPLSFSVTPVATGLRYAIGDFMVLPAGLETDEDRDGIIASGDICGQVNETLLRGQRSSFGLQFQAAEDAFSELLSLYDLDDAAASCPRRQQNLCPQRHPSQPAAPSGSPGKVRQIWCLSAAVSAC